MKIRILPVSLALLAITSGQAIAGACPNESQETTVSGTVTTSNISETIQVGAISLQLTSVHKQKVVFEESGALIGRITDQSFDEYGRPVSRLNHTIVFESGDSIETSGDQAVISGVLTECDLVVDEVISDFWGTKAFRKASGTINASGSINICGGQNRFELSGTICLKD
jgi:hypothetical protein